MLLTPIIVYDLLKAMHRFVGPGFRLQHELQQLSQNKSTETLVFREGDYWQGVAESFNQVRNELLELRNHVELQERLEEADLWDLSSPRELGTIEKADLERGAVADVSRAQFGG